MRCCDSYLLIKQVMAPKNNNRFKIKDFQSWTAKLHFALVSQPFIVNNMQTNTCTCRGSKFNTFFSAQLQPLRQLPSAM